MYPAGSVYISKAVTNLQMHKGLQTRPCKYQRCALLHISTRARFSLKDNSRERVSYLKSCFSNSLDAVSPSFELQGPCKHTQREKKNPHSIMKKQIGSQLLPAGGGNFRLPQRGGRERMEIEGRKFNSNLRKAIAFIPLV